MQTILRQLKIKADVVNSENNGIMSTYYLRLGPGAKVSKLENNATEIALALKSYSKPLIRVIPEKGLVAVELLVNPLRKVGFADVDRSSTSGPLSMVLGKTHDGKDLLADLSIMPHLLIAGTTGSGKSVMLHSILNSLLTSDTNIKLALIDPKKVELTPYQYVKQLLYPIITEPNDALAVLSDLVEEMEHRFRLMARARYNDIAKYNVKKKKNLPYIVLVIDEFSDLMHSSKKEFQKKLCMLAQKSRACGIHIIIATQRPSVDVVTGLIKANFPARISCRVSSSADSRVILGSGGAEKLLGKGDSLVSSIGLDMVRFQGAFLSEEEVAQCCESNKRSRWSRFVNYLRGA